MGLLSSKNSRGVVTLKWYLAILLLSGFACIPVQAYADEFNFGVKLLYFEIDIPEVDDPDNVGLVLSYDWAHKYGALGVEGDFTWTFLEGKIADADVEMNTLGVYGTYRNQVTSKSGMGPYFKGKAGFAYSDLSLGNETQDELNFSAGFGVGLNMQTVSVELEYTIIADNVDMVNLLVRF